MLGALLGGGARAPRASPEQRAALVRSGMASAAGDETFSEGDDTSDEGDAAKPGGGGGGGAARAPPPRRASLFLSLIHI